ncbi:XRE family transcriptional regulator [Gracilinema caldarium]|uniref:XRE family transcriptional regulator n=1 Tax=Gracilinema caldarium TaxID=215591 RepID=UPI0026F01D0A|nr:XRE family transcriptional regulator [Gracilinema caldarium]
MEYANRIEKILDYMNINQTELARILGVSRGIISEFSSGAREPSKDFLFAISKVLGVSIDWFLTGEGEMFLPGRDPRKKEAPTESAEAEKCNTVLHLPTDAHQLKNDTVSHLPAEPKYDTVSYLPPESTALTASRGLDIMGGGGGEIADPREIVVYRFQRGHPVPMEVREPDPEGAVLLPLWSQPTAAGPGQMPTQLAETERSIPVLYTLLGYRRPENCALVRVVGDSMSDVGLFNGDYVLFDRSDRSGDGIFVISLFGETRVKRLQYRLADKRIIIASENTKRYPEPEIVPFDFIQEGSLLIHGRVFAWLHRHPY